ncbi:hypothetical protein GYB57_15075 [bacterium]|nr:hypothetical protein [bacterium]
MRQIYYVLFLILISCNQEETLIIDGAISTESDFNALSNEEILWLDTLYPGQPYPKDLKGYESNVVIEVRTKKFESLLQDMRKKSLVKTVDSIVAHDLSHLIMLNGIEVDESRFDDLKKLSSNKLKSVSLQSKEVSKRIFKDRAGEINLIINTYNLNFKLE